jgi:hypothetical protein
MRKIVKGASLLMLAIAIPSMAVAATGTPQRSGDLPPGLAKKVLDPNSGILRAIIATVGSNSRLQDLEIPVSP